MTQVLVNIELDLEATIEREAEHFFFKFVWKFTIGVDFCSQSNNIDFFIQFRL